MGRAGSLKPQSHVVNVLNDTDNLIGSRILHWSGTEVPADGILVPKKLLRKSFVDDSHVPRISVVIFVDRASRQHSGADRIEEPRRDAGPVGGYIVLRRRALVCPESECRVPH